MDFTCCAELISNPLYYAAQYGNNFLNGLRVECSLSAFFIRLNHEEYNFVMKCVAWNVSYDDRAELILYDVPVKVGKDPIYFKLTLERVSMFVTEK